MPRVIDADVKEIMDTDIDTSPFIIAANTVVEARLLDQGLSVANLKEIERWLSAHFACAGDPREQEINVGGVGVGVRFEGKTGLYLESTRYGQMVKLLDTTGTLRELDQQLNATPSVAITRTARATVASRVELDSFGNPV